MGLSLAISAILELLKTSLESWKASGTKARGPGAKVGGLGAKCRKARLWSKRSVNVLSVEFPKGRGSGRGESPLSGTSAKV